MSGRTREEALNSIWVMLEYLEGENYTRPGIQDTPKRVVNSWEELI